MRLLAAALLATTGISVLADPASSLTSAQRVELAVFGMKAMGLPASIGNVAKIPNSKDTQEMTATGLNLNGYLCATVISIRPLKVKGGYEVTCVANRGGSARKSYTVDASSGKANEL